jgi:hypothetical protein
METPGTLADEEPNVGPFGGSYGLGWLISSYRDAWVGGHSGSFITGFSSAMVRLPGQGLGVIVLTNQHGANPIRLAYGIVGLYESGLRPPHALTPEPDRTPNLTRRVERFVRGLMAGGEDDPDAVAPFLRKRLAGYPKPPESERPPVEVAFIASEDLRRRALERNGTRIARMSHYNVVIGGEPACLTFYFDDQGRIAAYSGY